MLPHVFNEVLQGAEGCLHNDKDVIPEPSTKNNTKSSSQARFEDETPFHRGIKDRIADVTAGEHPYACAGDYFKVLVRQCCRLCVLVSQHCRSKQLVIFL